MIAVAAGNEAELLERYHDFYVAAAGKIAGHILLFCYHRLKIEET